MSEAGPTPPTTPAAGPLPPTVLLAVGIAAVEGLGVLAYAVGIVVSGFANPGSIAAPFVEAVIYVLFAAGLLLVAWLMLQRRRAGRTPFLVAQLFALVVAYTLLSGDGDAVHVVGVATGVLGAVGLVVSLLPSTGEALDR